VLVFVARPPRAVAITVGIPVAAVKIIAVCVTDRAPIGGLKVAVVLEGAVRVRSAECDAVVVAATVLVAVAASIALVVFWGAFGRAPVVPVGIAAVPVTRAVRVLVAAIGEGVVAGGALKLVVWTRGAAVDIILIAAKGWLGRHQVVSAVRAT